MSPEYAARRFREKSHAWLSTGLARCPHCGGVPQVTRHYGGDYSVACCEDYDHDGSGWRRVAGVVVTEATYEDAWAAWNDAALEGTAS